MFFCPLYLHNQCAGFGLITHLSIQVGKRLSHMQRVTFARNQIFASSKSIYSLKFLRFTYGKPAQTCNRIGCNPRVRTPASHLIDLQQVEFFIINIAKKIVETLKRKRAENGGGEILLLPLFFPFLSPSFPPFLRPFFNRPTPSQNPFK